MVSALVSGSSGHCIVFFSKTLNTYSTSLCPGILIGTGDFNGGVTLQWTSNPSWEG